MELTGRYVVAGTGSRSFVNLDVEERDRVTHELKMYLLAKQFLHPEIIVMSGGAEGWDYTLAETAYELRIPYVLCLPNTGYGRYYYGPRQSLTGSDNYPNFEEMCRNAVEIEYTSVHLGLKPDALYSANGQHLNFARNARMVELADMFVVYNPESSGTKHCVELLKRFNVRYKVF